MPDAFKHQDKVQVPLVWQHGHTDPENVLGHVLLSNRGSGVWCEGFFNKTTKGKHAQELVEHKDINSLSIWANGLIEQAKRVTHGMIREVSLVLAGANPGARIENVTVRHADGDDEYFETLDDEAIIYTGVIEHADTQGDDVEGDDETVQDVYDSMNEKQKQVLHFMVGEALESAGVEHSDLELDDDASAQEIYDTMLPVQKELLHSMISEALEEAANSNINDDPKGKELMHNIFENSKDHEPAAHLSHDDIKIIVADASRTGSLKTAVENYALSHGIEDIDVLFPEAKTLADSPEIFGRRVEWVGKLMGDVRKSPFSRIKTISADITVAEARAKGYIKGTLKKEEFFGVSKRITTPTTVYKKQKLDRDDMIDITDFDVVTWLKAEMRIMLDEEIARAILVGDGRASDDEDKIREPAGGSDGAGIRSIANDHELYTTVVNVNLADGSSSMNEVTDQITLHRSDLRGSGLPTMFTTETYIARYLTLRDSLGRRIYQNLDQVALELRVKEVVAVEVLEEYTDIIAILVNPMDYVVGTDAGGQVSMFDNFDIDYNQYKYLIETRLSGALVKLKSAMVVKSVSGTLIVPTAPTFDEETGELTITNTANVVYRRTDTDAVVNAAGSPYTIASGDSITITATADSTYYFESGNDDEWTFTAE
jgi:hypothetical protein